MTLGGYDDRFAADDGRADPRVRLDVAATSDGQVDSYLAAIVALCGSRLLVPVLAHGDDGLVADPERAGEVAAVLLQRPDGARALPAFTGVDAVERWHRQARPIPATLDRVAQTAKAEGATTVVVDLAGPASLVIEGELLDQLAHGHRLVRLTDGFGWLAPQSPASEAPST